MGSGASIPDRIDRETFEQLAGGRFNPGAFDHFCEDDGNISKEKLIFLAEQTDVYLSHACDLDSLGRDNHQRVEMINRMLKEKKLITNCDDGDYNGEDLQDKISSAIENTRVVLVFITKNYLKRVTGSNGKDRLKLEFGYSCRRKGQDRMIPIIMEPECIDPNTRYYLNAF